MTKTRITAYIKTTFGEEVLNEVKEGKRTVSVNGVVIDGTAANFRDKRVTENSRVEISDKTSSYETTVTENTINNANHEEKKIEQNDAVTSEASAVEVIESPITTEAPTPPTGVRYKKCYQAIREGKSAPAGATVFTSEKSGKQYYVKIIGEDKYL